MKMPILFVILISVFSVQSFALTGAELEKKREWSEYIAKQQDTYIKPLCGKVFVIKLSDSLVQGYLKANSSPKGYLDTIFWALKQSCKDKESAKNFTKNFKGMKIVFGKKLEMKKKKKVMIMKLPTSVPDLSTPVSDFLKGNF